MKEKTHPKWYPNAEVVVNGEVVMTVGSTKPKLNVEIWSGTHPFYTGQQRLVDTEGQVDRFLKRLQKREELVVVPEEEEEVITASPTIQPYTVIKMTKRAEEGIKEAGLETIGDLLNLYQESGEDGLLTLRGVGQKAVIDIKKFLRSHELID